MAAGELDLIVLGDLHYVGKARHTIASPVMKGELGLELLQRVLRREEIAAEADAVVLMGDLVDEGNAEGAEADLRALSDLIAQSGLPIIVLPGNHDRDAERLMAIFADKLGAHELNGYALFSFVDSYAPDEVCTRDKHDLDTLRAYAASHRDKPIIALQHNPLYPPIENDYPYVLKNASETMRAYDEGGVMLSISGHYHRGQPLSHVGRVDYVTCPALCEAPFRFLRVKIRGRKVTVTEESLVSQSSAPLCDVHIHSEFAYCGHGITAKDAIDRAGLFGLTRICLTEHADQLYLTDEDFHANRIKKDPELPHKMREAGRDRYAAYRTFSGKLRSEFVRLGLEVELNSQFEPILLEEDREGWDIFVGGVHWMTDDMVARSGGTIEKCFMRMNEALLKFGVDVLAHPFRYFVRRHLPTPKYLYRPLAQMLKEYDTAAEINFHTNRPDPDFFAICMEEGVKIAFGSDSHEAYEVGELGLHLNVLRQAGVSDADLPNVLFQL